MTDARGTAEFATIYPGWYAGRTIHIHVKVHTANHVSHTGQFFLPEDITEQIAKLEPYVKHTNVHRITHEEDHVFGDQHGSESMATLKRLQNGSNEGGFLAMATFAVDVDATPALVGPGRGRG